MCFFNFYFHLLVGVMDFSYLLLLSGLFGFFFCVFPSFSEFNLSLALWLLGASYVSINSFSAVCLSFHKEVSSSLGLNSSHLNAFLDAAYVLGPL